MRLKLIFAAFALLLIAVVIKAASTSQLQIVINNGTGSDTYSYTVTNQANNQSKTTTTTSTKEHRFLDRGIYQILIKHGNQTFFGTASTKGFFATTTFFAQLDSERDRSFSGGNPASCMFTVGTLLLSDDCLSSSGDVIFHVPGTAKLTTYAMRYTGLSSTLSASLDLGNGSAIAVSNTSPHSKISNTTLYLLKEANNSIQVADKITLNSLSDSGNRYLITKYRDGFLLYDDTIQHAYYFASLKAEPQPINLAQPSRSGLTGMSLSVNASGDILATYSEEVEGEGKSTPKNDTSEIIFTKENGSSTRYQYNRHLTESNFCGQKWCTLNVDDQSAEVLDPANPDSPIAKVADARHIGTSVAGTYIIRGQELMHYDADNLSGFVEYSFGNYKLCGANLTASGLVLCVDGGNNWRQALRINESSVAQDNIDESMLALRAKTTIVRNLSIYNHFITIVPQGKLIMSQDGKSLTPDPVSQPLIDNQILTEAAKLNINRDTYTLNITLPLAD